MAALWCAIALYFSHLPLWWVLPAVAISAAILLWTRHASDGSEDADRSHVGRLVAIWSSAEGVAIFVAANVLINLHMAERLLPTMAIIVGLHFLPLARGIPARIYYWSGAALILVGAIGWLLPAGDTPLVTGLLAAATLWVSALASAKRGRA
ncbi:DUF7010 family protein [Sphingomonas sp. CJ20]